MRNWERSLFVSAIVLGAALGVSHTAAIADSMLPPPAPEIDPTMVVAGLGVAGGAIALIWERLRRRR